MASLLYYQFSNTVISDHEYDAMAAFVRDNFEAVPPKLRFCIGEEWAIDDGICGWTSSGFQFKYHQRLYYGAVAWGGLDDAPDFEMVDYDMANDVEFAVIRS